METILEVKDLTKTFVTEGKADFTAIDHINFRLYPGAVSYTHLDVYKRQPLE